MTANAGGQPAQADEVLSKITGALVGHFDMDPLLSQVVDISMNTLHAQVCSIFLEDRDKEPGVLTMRAGSGFAEPLVGVAKYQVGEGFTGFVAKHRQRLNIRSRDELESLAHLGGQVWQGKYDQRLWPSGESEFRNCIAMPLQIKDYVLGVIKVENKRTEYGDQFTEDEVRYFETIANVVALAVENARLHLQTETQLKSIAAKAAHRIANQSTNYDGIELELRHEASEINPDRARLGRMADRIGDTTTGLKRMIEEFGHYGRPLQLSRVRVNLNELVRNEVWYSKPHDVEICQDLDDKIPPMLLDAQRLAEAIKELLKNSKKALTAHPPDGGGRINVVSRLGTIDDASGLARTAAVVRVEDNGPGFPEDFPLFQPFRTTDPGHTGLGLATVKELVEAHGGVVRVVHRGRPGACVEFRIPVQ